MLSNRPDVEIKVKNRQAHCIEPEQISYLFSAPRMFSLIMMPFYDWKGH